MGCSSHHPGECVVIENSAAGLTMLAGEVTVTGPREEDHQAAFARYAVAPGGQRQVAVELGWCRIGTGKYSGQHAIEVRLDGRRVGELTYLMSQRYAPLLRQVPGRPGCEAYVQRSARGLEIVLRLPRADAEAPTFVMAPAPPAREPAERPRRGRKIAWGVAAAVVGLLVIGSIANGTEDPSGTATDVMTTTEPLPTTEPAPPTTTTTTTTTTTATVAPKPKPRPKPKPKPAPPVAPEPEPAPEPAPSCHPSYTPCLPIVSDVDCPGGSGDGPVYAPGPVQVTGPDEYDLDRDGDGTGCD
jgi:hypothetical protein